MDGTPAAVDEPAAPTDLVEEGLVGQVPGRICPFACKRDRAGDDIGPGCQFLEGDKGFRTFGIGSGRVIPQDGHTEEGGQFLYFFPHMSDSDDAQCLSL